MASLRSFALTATIFAAPAYSWAGATTPTVAAEYTGGSITAEEIAAYAHSLQYPYSDPWAAYFEAVHDSPQQADTSDILRLCAEEILWDRTMAQEARQKGFVLPRALEVEAEKRYDDCVADAWRNSVANRITTLSLETISRMMEKDRRPFFQEEQRQVAYIFLQKDGPKADKPAPEKHRLLRDLKWRIESGELDFADAAKRFSEAASAPSGGRIGWVRRGDRYHPAFKNLVFQTAAGSLSDAVELHNGYYLVKVESVIPDRNPSAEEVAKDVVLAAEALRLARAEAVAEAEKAAVAAAPEASSAAKAIVEAARRDGLDDSMCSLTQALLLDRFVARAYYAASVTDQITVTEEDARKYYDENPTQMRESGIFRLTRFTVPTQARKGQPARSLEKASQLAEAIRNDLIGGTSDNDLLRRWEPKGLIVEETSGWEQGTGIGPADKELLHQPEGYISKIHPTTTGVVFFRLDGKRDLPLIPFEVKREQLLKTLKDRRVAESMIESRKAVAERLRLRPRWY
jgi:parvulin-like peptidyl-prolyl isomerase